MNSLRARFSIRTKLTIVIMVASLLILLLVSGAFVAVDSTSSYHYMLSETQSIAETLGTNLKPALLNNDKDQAEQLLSSLALKNSIRAAYLFDAEGLPLASYQDQRDSSFLLKLTPADFSAEHRPFWTTSLEQKVLKDWSHLSLFLPLQANGQRVGTLYLLRDLDDLYGRLSGVVFGACLSLALLLGLSWWMAGLLQRPVSQPLLSLVETMKSISLQQNFSLRANKQSEDEIGDLVEGFNEMLGQLESHRQRQERYQEDLELTVERRTSELREMVRALQQTKQQLESAGQAKSEFIATITHELRTPLIGVLGMNELLFRTPLNQEQRNLAKTVQKSGEDLLLLINNILDFSRIEAGKLKLEPVDFSLSSLVETILELMARQAEAKGLTLVCDISKDCLVQVRGDELRLKQILLNLVGNAIKFTQQGEVRVSVERLSDQAGLARFQLNIRDSGIGMDEETRQKIFSAFYQADNTSTRDYGGSGLGLAIVSQLIELMNGELALESVPGQGSCFSLILGFDLIESMEMPLLTAGLRQRVLVCQEQLVTADVLVSRLEELGLQVETLSSAAQAWYQLGAAKRAAQEVGWFFCASEVLLPDGEPLYQALRNDPQLRQLRRILVPASRFAQMVLEPMEVLLSPPLTWPGLQKALRANWGKLLQLKMPSPSEHKEAAPLPELKNPPSVLVAGSGVASRELVKLGLQGRGYSIETANDLSGLLGRERLFYAALFLDLSFLPQIQLQALLTSQSEEPVILLYEHESQLQGLPAANEHRVLKKPFSRDQLIAVLSSLHRPTEGASDQERG